MVVPTTGPLSLKGIANEKNQDDYTSDDGEVENNISLRGLSNNNFNDYGSENINLNSASGSNPPNQTEPYQMSEFRGYNHDFAPAQASWTNGTSAYDTGTTWANVAGSGASTGSSLGKVISQINLTWGSSGLAWSLVDDHVNCDVSSSGDETTSSGMNTAFAISNFTNGGCTKVEARWRVVGGIATVHNGTGNKITANYHRTGAQANTHSGNRDLGTNIATATNSSLNFTDSYRDISPSVMGGSYNNSQSHSVAAEIGGSTSTYDGDDVRLRTGTSSTHGLFFDIRLTKQDGTTTTKSFFKNYTSASDRVDIYYEEFEVPDFTCIMPDMIVNEQTKGYIRIGDIVVGDRILARGDLSDSSAPEQYVEVTEARTHTRSGYWNVDGIHITNDHPVWLTDESSSAWVKVEDMRDGITRNYVAGTVDPVYLGTNPGWYYVWSADRTKGFTVSGDYAPTTE